MRAIARGFMVAVGLTVATSAFGQLVVINEIVEDEQSATSSDISPDTREFVELYNADTVAVDLDGWTLSFYDLGVGSTTITDTLPSHVLNPGEYFVIGAPGVPNVNYSPVATDLWPNGNSIFELRSPDTTLVDAVGLETFRGTELANATQEQLDQLKVGQTAGPAAQGGFWGQVESDNTVAPNGPLSIGRYLDGRDNNVNGRDFGMLPVTPGASNNLPQNATHTIPDVDAMSPGDKLGTDYYASFILPRVIDPTVASGINPSAIAASPEGGNAIVAWDESGGGNASYSREYVDHFELAAYIDPTPLNSGGTAVQSEATIYGIGTTDVFFATPDSDGLLAYGSSANGSTGIGWLIQRVEDIPNTTDTTILQLVDFNDGGDSVPADADWTVIQSIDLSSDSADWHNLSIDYNPTTGEVVATHNNDTYNFTTDTDLVGNFYVGYRENLSGNGSPFVRPPTFDLFVATGLPGDHNGDGTVDAADYALWRSDPGTYGGAQGYTDWVDNFGATLGSGQGPAVVPEPSSLALVMLGLLAVGTRRRRS